MLTQVRSTSEALIEAKTQYNRIIEEINYLLEAKDNRYEVNK